MAESIDGSLNACAFARTIVHDDVIIFSTHMAIEIFVVFIFAVANLSAKTAKFCTMRNFSAIHTICVILWQIWPIYECNNDTRLF